MGAIAASFPEVTDKRKPILRILLGSLANAKDMTVAIGANSKATSNAPRRANKGSYYEGGIHVPSIIKWPGVSRAGRVIGEPVVSNDLYRTCLSTAGAELNPNQHMDGVNLKPLLSATEDLPRESLFWHFPTTTSIPPAIL